MIFLSFSVGLEQPGGGQKMGKRRATDRHPCSISSVASFFVISGGAAIFPRVTDSRKLADSDLSLNPNTGGVIEPRIARISTHQYAETLSSAYLGVADMQLEIANSEVLRNRESTSSRWVGFFTQTHFWRRRSAVYHRGTRILDRPSRDS